MKSSYLAVLLPPPLLLSTVISTCRSLLKPANPSGIFRADLEKNGSKNSSTMRANECFRAAHDKCIFSGTCSSESDVCSSSVMDMWVRTRDNQLEATASSRFSCSVSMRGNKLCPRSTTKNLLAALVKRFFAEFQPSPTRTLCHEWHWICNRVTARGYQTRLPAQIEINGDKFGMRTHNINIYGPLILPWMFDRDSTHHSSTDRPPARTRDTVNLN